jgi:hypothetical protein
MPEFKPIQLSDKQWVRECVRQTDFRGCEYAFGTAYMWSGIFGIQIARCKDFCLYKTANGFLIPSGQGRLEDAVCVLKSYCREHGIPLLFTNADCSTLEHLQCLYGDGIEISTNRDYYDYIYDYESLATLSGRKLHAKRNHLHRFCENNWCFEPISEDNIEEVAAMHNRWCDEKGVYADPAKLREAGAVVRGLESFFELGFTGGLIRIENECGDMEIQAYTFGSAIGNRCNDTFTVHVEKAFSTTQGLYAAINKEFISRVGCESGCEYKYVNREEDMGAENLRKAKLSYRPAYLHEKYRVLFKG